MAGEHPDDPIRRDNLEGTRRHLAEVVAKKSGLALEPATRMVDASKGLT